MRSLASKGLARCALLVGALASSAWAAQSYPVETLRETGPADHRIDIAILGDGYRAEDQAQLTADARSVMEHLFASSPFLDYAALFNVRLVHVLSTDRGAAQGSAPGTPSTALGASFGCNGIDRLLCVDDETVSAVAARNVPDYDVLVVVVNDAKYGGSGGQIATVSRAPLSADILRHELGHTLAHLADEYADPYPGYPACASTRAGAGDCPEANATLETDRSKLKWSSWVDAQTQLPTRQLATDPVAVGAFEGCRYQASGVFRPVGDSCLMRRLEDSAGHSEQLCPVCSEAMVRAFWSQTSMVDGFAPASVTPEVTPCGPVTFSVRTPPLEATRLSLLWTVDGAPKQVGSPSFQLAQQDLAPGKHTVTARVEDHTALVRDDPGAGVMQQQQSWEIHVQDGRPGTCQPGPCDETAACSEGACITTHKPVGTPCGPPSCEAGVGRGPRACNADGACVPQAAPESCGQYACDGSGVACRGFCSVDTDCAEGSRCVDAVCRPGSLPPPPPAHGCQSVPAELSGLALAAVASLLGRRRRRASQAR